jgi:regulator of sigma E protease
VHELGHFIFARRFGVRVEKFSFGFGPKLFSIKRGDTEYLVSAIPLGGYVKMAGEDPRETLTNEGWEYLSKKVSQRFSIIFAGPAFNYILAFFIFSFIYMFGSPTPTTEVGSLLKGYPAEKAGIAIGDKVLTVDGKNVKHWEDMTAIIHKKVEGNIRLSVERKGRIFEFEITPMVRETKDIFGKKAKIALVGIAPSQAIENVRYGFFDSFKMGFNKLIQLTVITYKALFAIFTGALSLRESMTGPIGIFIITGTAAKHGLIYILHLMALLSASLAIFNLLPLPVLDGGHIIFLALEKIRGRPLPVRTQELITNIGISFLILLMALVFYNDMLKFGVFDKAASIFRK